MAGSDRHVLGQVFNEVPELYDRVRPSYPDELFADLAAVTGIHDTSSVLEVGCGTGQATRPLAALGCSITAVEPGVGMAALARERLSTFGNIVWLGFLTALRVAAMTVLATLIWTPVGVWIGFQPKVARFAQPLAQIGASFPVRRS